RVRSHCIVQTGAAGFKTDLEPSPRTARGPHPDRPPLGAGIDSRSALSYDRTAIRGPGGGVIETPGEGMSRSEGKLGQSTSGGGAADRVVADPPGGGPGERPSTTAVRVAMFYDMDACHAPTGVTRHALAQLERLARRPGMSLSVLTGRMTHP